MERRTETKAERKDRIAGTIAGIVIFAVSILTIWLATPKQPKVTSYEYIEVMAGDTLWEIAKESNGYGKMDIRDIIADMKVESDNLKPHDIVAVPQYEEK